MKYVLALIVLLCASICPAQIIVSDQLPPMKYPAAVYKMTNAEFFEWASAYNLAQLEDWKKRKAAIAEPEYLTGSETVTTCEYNYGYFARSPRYGHGGYGGHGVPVQQVTYPRRWPNPFYVGPGPLVIVNPYVRPR